MVMEKYASQANIIKELNDNIAANPVYQSIRSWHQGQASSSPNPPNGSALVPTVSRTAASPQWAGETVWNFRKRLQFNAIDVGTFDTSITFHGISHLGLRSLQHEPMNCKHSFLKPPTFFNRFKCVLFHSTLRLDVKAPLARVPDLEICISTSNQIWLVNRLDRTLDVDAGELFGFGLGSYVDAQSGMALLEQRNNNSKTLECYL